MKKHKVIVIVLLSGLLFLGLIGLVRFIDEPPVGFNFNNEDKEKIMNEIKELGNNQWDSVAYNKICLSIIDAKHLKNIDFSDESVLLKALYNAKSTALIKSFENSFIGNCMNYTEREFLINEMKNLLTLDSFPLLEKKIEEHNNLINFIDLNKNVNIRISQKYDHISNNILKREIKAARLKDGVYTCSNCLSLESEYIYKLDEHERIDGLYHDVERRYNFNGSYEIDDILQFENYRYYKMQCDSLLKSK